MESQSLSMRDWDKLFTFYLVAKYKSFTKAASALAISQPAVSQHIIFLEERYRESLIHRKNKKNLFLTEKGIILYQSLKGVIAELSNIENDVFYSSHNISGNIKVYCVSGVFTNWLIPFFLEFNKIYPDINFEVYGSNFDIDLTIDNYDIVIMPTPLNYQGFSCKKILSFHLGLYADEQYLLEEGVPHTVEDLATHRMIAIIPEEKHSFGFVNWHLGLGEPKGSFKKPVISLSETKDLILAANNKMGIASIVKGHPLLKDHSLVEVLPDIPKPQSNLFIIAREKKLAFGKVKLFYNYLTKKIKEMNFA